ncbi:MAG: FAD-dependent oxidoreductase, partial [Dehalococcoidia bacterium]|nr:FAD-dependent oxidoreductase [Dehalococcoidia bacterium]
RRTNCLPGILGRTCVAFCEKNCVRGDIDQPLAIRALKRLPAEYGITKLTPEKVSKKEKVAVVGSGPAGMVAADYLAHQGYQVYLIDEESEPGGMTAAGIPSYRLPRRVINNEFDIIKSAGVQYKPSTRVGHAEDLMLNVKAVLVASGAHQSKDAGIAGWSQNCQGCLEGVQYLRLANAGKDAPPAERVIVVGGGNTAIDCARTAVRLGAKEVTVVYRRSRTEMPARADEVEAAKKEGVKFHFLALPLKLLADNNKVTGAECQRMELGEPDASGRRRPVPAAGSEFVIPAELVLTAIGEQPELSFLPKGKVALTEWGSIKADEGGRTSLPWLFAAGDCATGPATIVEAMADAKRAARSLDCYVSKSKDSEEKPLGELLHELGLVRKRYGSTPSVQLRQHPQEIHLKERTATFDEVEQCFTPEAASKEAARCLRCYRVMIAVT